jgi:hypothetical protein
MISYKKEGARLETQVSMQFALLRSCDANKEWHVANLHETVHVANGKAKQ